MTPGATPPPPNDLPGNPLTEFMREIRRRRVHRVVLAYGAGAFAVLQGVELLVDGLGWNQALLKWTLVASVLGFFAAVGLGWLYDFEEGELRRTVRDPEDDPEPGRLTVRYIIGVLGALAAGVLLWLFGPLPTHGRVVAGADVIAVFPFRASGPGTEGLGEGMVDLLSTNLDEVGDIRTVDPSRTLTATADRGGSVQLSQEEMIRLGRDMAAGSILGGTLSVAGGTARLRAELLSTADASELAVAEVEGPEGEIFHLVDSLSVEVLRDVWRSESPLPNLDLSAVTTSDPRALRLYLQGEAYRRRARWDSAEAALRGAVEADSTFALATETLASVLGWSDPAPINSPEISRLRAMTLRHIHRLPENARRAVRADLLWKQGQFHEAQDSLFALLSDDPEDPRAWFVLGEVRYHGRFAGAFPDLPSDSIHAAFKRGLSGVPQDAPALLHPIGLSMAEGLEGAFQGYMARFRESAGPVKAGALRGAGEYLFRREGVFTEALSGLVREAPVLLREFLLGLLREPGHDPVALGDTLLALADRAPFETDDEVLTRFASFLNAIGRWPEARNLLQRSAEGAPVLTGQTWGTTVAVGMAPITSIPAEALATFSELAGLPVGLQLDAMAGLWRGDPGAADSFLRWLDDLDTLSASAALADQAIHAWREIVQGDTAAFLPVLEEAVGEQFRLASSGDQMPGNFLLLPTLRIRAAQEETASDALERLETHPWLTGEILAPVTLARAEALLTLGRTEDARASLERVVRLLGKAGEGVYPLARAQELLSGLEAGR